MFDFEKLKKAQHEVKSIDPVEIFYRLPKSGSINDLYQSQIEVLRDWNSRRSEKDLVIKLPTGGGKH
jgi:superfamily II DNA or RNA helicase